MFLLQVCYDIHWSLLWFAEDTPLAPAALHSLCTLVKEKPDFNFAVNIMDIVVKRVGRKGWDDVSSEEELSLHLMC